jgi:FecR protein
MKRTLPSILTPFVLIVILFISGSAFGRTTGSFDDESADVDDSAPVARVARLSFVEGDVSFLRAGVTEWAPAVENLPLLAGDQVYAGRGARAEVQLGRGSYIRLSESTELTIADLSDSAAQFEITEGRAIIRLERLATAFHRFEVDTPNTAVVIQQDGLYRVEVRSEKNSELIVRRGDAEASTEEGSFRVREGHRLLVDTTTGGKLELALDTTQDEWDQWSNDRDTTIAHTSADIAPDYVTNVETDNSDFYGVSDLSSYGTWTNYSSYGQCWIPRVGPDWAPYRSGQWLWIPATGWTWLSSEPWGWAPYHYGRWAYLSGLGWAWVPGFGSPYGGYGYRDYHWRPALVFFFNSPTPSGNYVGWYPLAPGERWHRPDHRRGDDRARLPFPSPRDGGKKPGAGRPHILPQPHRGMTILPLEGFTRGDRSARPAAPGRELSDAINKGARAGLPDIKPSPVGVAPVLGENDRRSLRRIAVPPNEIIRRPVVTRNANTDASGQQGAQRERRLVSPPNPGAIPQGTALVERGTDRKPRSPANAGSQPGADTGGEGQSPKVRLRLPAPSEKVNDGSAPQRKSARDGNSAPGGPPQKSEGSTGVPGSDSRRPHSERSATPAPKENPSGDKQKDNSTRSRDNGAPTPRAEPRPEPPNSEARQERQQQQDQRKKP